MLKGHTQGKRLEVCFLSLLSLIQTRNFLVGSTNCSFPWETPTLKLYPDNLEAADILLTPSWLIGRWRSVSRSCQFRYAPTAILGRRILATLSIWSSETGRLRLSDWEHLETRRIAVHWLSWTQWVLLEKKRQKELQGLRSKQLRQ